MLKLLIRWYMIYLERVYSLTPITKYPHEMVKVSKFPYNEIIVYKNGKAINPNIKELLDEYLFYNQQKILSYDILYDEIGNDIYDAILEVENLFPTIDDILIFRISQDGDDIDFYDYDGNLIDYDLEVLDILIYYRFVTIQIKMIEEWLYLNKPKILKKQNKIIHSFG